MSENVRNFLKQVLNLYAFVKDSKIIIAMLFEMKWTLIKDLEKMRWDKVDNL